MKVVAITGGVACGKSTLLNALSNVALSKKHPTFNCDSYISTLYQNPQIIAQILQTFPSIFANNTLNKTTLKQAILKEGNIILKKLQKILYPHLYKQISHFITTNRQKNTPIVFIENPLVFETRKTHNYNAVILVHSPIYKRKAQFAKRSNDLALWKLSTQNQWPHAKKLGTKTTTKKLEFFLHSVKFQNKQIAALLKKL